MCQMVIFALAYTVSEKLNELVTFSNQEILHRKPSGFLASQGVTWAHIPIRRQSTVPGTWTFLHPVEGVGPFTTSASTTPSCGQSGWTHTWSADPCRHLRFYSPWSKWSKSAFVSWHCCDCLARLGTTVPSPELEPAARQRDSMDPEETGPSQGKHRTHLVSRLQPAVRTLALFLSLSGLGVEAPLFELFRRFSAN